MTALLEAAALRKDFGAVAALRGLTLTVRTGEIYGLVGPDGAGKTTTLRLLVGLLRPTAGEARVGGSPALALRSRGALGYVPQAHALYGDLSVGENLDFFAAIHGLPEKLYRERRRDLLAATELAHFVDRRAGVLSGGMYKKLALACALLHQPALLVLDEPTTGVDPISRAHVWELLRARVGEGMGVLVSTSYMDEAAQCDRVGMLLHGRLIDEGSPRELLARFGHDVYLVVGGDRDLLQRAFEGHPSVVAAAPASGALRVIARRADAALLSGEAARHGATMRPTPSRFDDVFLARMREAPA